MTVLQVSPVNPSPELPGVVTIADLLEFLDGIPAHRVRMHPLPGTATERDVIENDAKKGPPCELVDGVLVEKPMGIIESMLAMVLGMRITNFVLSNNLGISTGPDGMLRLMPGLVRGPDIAFISWDRLPDRQLPNKPVPNLAPNLAIEILSSSNTKREMRRKLNEYFDAGVQLVWYFDPEPRTVSVYRNANDEPLILTSRDTLDGETVLPGFTLPLGEFFAVLDRSGNPIGPIA